MTLVEPGAPTAIEGGTGPGGAEDFGEARPLRVEVWRRFKRNRMATVALAFVLLLILVAIFAPLIAPFEFDQRVRGEQRLSPSLDHLFGTDDVGYDVFSRVVYGARVSLRIGILSTLIAVVIGVVVGSVAGYVGGAVDTLLMRGVDILLSIPYYVLAVAIAVVLTRSENTVIVVLGLTSWLPMARIVRSSVLGLRRLEYIEAARALGYSNTRIILRHVLPNAIQPIIVYGTISIGSIILAEAALSFLQVGPRPPIPAWGLMVRDATGQLRSDPHMLFFPGAAIFLTVVAFLYVGDGLRDALDPKLK
jgi:ABC-type dipeptide/oligopeptide/nickel transport system permease subunit